MRPFIRSSALLSLGFALACSSHQRGDPDSEPRPRASRRTDLITSEEIERKHWTSVYDMVSELHANWLNVRGPDTLMGEPGAVQVQLDDIRLGDASSLRSMPVVNIAYVQYYDPISASARWGLGYNHGAIYVSTRNR